MQLKTFNLFVRKVVSEGIRLQKYDIDGKLTTSNRFTSTQIISFVLGSISIFFLKSGFSKEFAGYIISFLGIFIGLFSTIVISLYDRNIDLFKNIEHKDHLEVAKVRIIRNYLVQFTGLISFAILLGLIITLLLTLVLLNDFFNIHLFEFGIITDFNKINLRSVTIFFKILINTIHRFLVVCLLVNFFFISTYAITSYFSFLLSEYNKMKIK